MAFLLLLITSRLTSAGYFLIVNVQPHNWAGCNFGKDWGTIFFII